MPDEQQPLVTILIPCRNEADFIEQCVHSVLDSDYPADKIEVLVLDGMSTDGTRDILARLCNEDSRVSLYENAQKIVPTALNTGILNAKGEVIIPVSGHATVAKDFIRESVRQLQAHREAWCAGGAVETVNPRYFGRAVAAAMSSPVGVGNAMWRLGNYEGFVDTVAFGAYWRWVFDKVGLFDEELVRNQDDEFNLRIVLAGGKIWMSKSIKSKYFSRGSLGKLWRQYFQYGFWRISTLQKHKRPATIRQLVPLLFTLSLGTLALAGLFKPIAWKLLSVELVLYVLVLLVGAVGVGARAGWRYALPAPLVFVILHLAYGLGCMWGIIRFIVLRGWMMKTPEEAKLSR